MLTRTDLRNLSIAFSKLDALNDQEKDIEGAQEFRLIAETSLESYRVIKKGDLAFASLRALLLERVRGDRDAALKTISDAGFAPEAV